MDFRHLIVTCLFSKLRLPFDNQKVKENYAIFFKIRTRSFFYLTCCFWGSRISHMYVPLYTYVRAADTCFVLYDILSSFRIYFHFFIVSLRRKSVI